MRQLLKTSKPARAAILQIAGSLASSLLLIVSAPIGLLRRPGMARSELERQFCRRLARG